MSDLLSKTGSSLVEIRIFKASQMVLSWEELKPVAYLPVFLTGVQNQDNITKRIIQTYFKRPSDIQKIRWNIRGEASQGYDILSPFI